MKTSRNVADVISFDAFARLRTSQPETIFDSKQLHDNAPLFWDDQEVSGGGTSSTHSTAKASTTIGVSETTAGKRVRQTFMRFNYQPGKSQLVFMTGTLVSGGGAGITAGMGLFDDNNGIFVKYDEGTIKLVRRSKASGTVVDTEVAQADWNINRLTEGRTSKKLDPTKSQIFFFNMEWLGVGSVQCGWVIDNELIYCHSFDHANRASGVYMSTPNLPLRYEIANDGTGAASTLEHICSTVISEGGMNDNGILQYHSTAGTHLDAAAVNTIYAILGFRLKSTHLDASIKFQRIAVQLQTSSDSGEWLWILNPTVANTFTYADKTNSALQIATGGATNTVTNGYIMAGGYVSTGTASSGTGGVDVPIPNALLLGSNIAGTPDTFVLCWRPLIGTDQDVEASVQWREIS